MTPDNLNVNHFPGPGGTVFAAIEGDDHLTKLIVKLDDETLERIRAIVREEMKGANAMSDEEIEDRILRLERVLVALAHDLHSQLSAEVIHEIAEDIDRMNPDR